ncbi:hypothetical protein R1sor_018582 [Riccia sorocarpa]|uniref:Uncharacterized protein n=1 Tax=Riccia sorocarpa TaxID=122646 RepID=A0ABD3IA42_9MARC
MGSRSVLSSTLDTDRKLRTRSITNRDEVVGRRDPGRLSRNSKAQTLCSEGPLVKPRIEAFCRGSWWEVEIHKQRSKIFYVRYLSKDAGEQFSWLPLKHLRLKSRAGDRFDCSSLKRGTDVSVNSTHPDYRELDLHPKGLYDAKIMDVKRAYHDDRCTCLFRVRFYSADSEDPAESTRSLSRCTIAICVNISTVKILQQVGVVPFDEILETLYSGDTKLKMKWSNDVFHLQETKLYLDRPLMWRNGDRCFKDHDRYLCSSKAPHSRKPETSGVPTPKSIPPGSFSGPDTGTSTDPLRGSANLAKLDTDSSTAKVKMCGRNDSKDSKNSRAKAACIDSNSPDRNRFPVCAGDPSSSVERPTTSQRVSKRSRNEHSDTEDSYGKAVSMLARIASSLQDLQKGNEDEIVDIGGGSSDEDTVDVLPPSRKLRTSRRSPDDSSGDRARASSVTDEGPLKPPENKAYNGVLPDVQFTPVENGGGDREVDDMDHDIKRSTAEATEGRLRDGDDLNIPPFKNTSVRVSKLSGRWYDEDPRKRSSASLRVRSGSADRKSDGGLDKSRIVQDHPDVRVANSESDDCDVLITDPIVKRHVTEGTEGLKARRKKGHCDVPGKPYVRPEDNQAAEDSSKPSNKSRSRACRMTQVTSTEAKNPASLGQGSKKPSFTRRTGSHQKSPPEPLYKSLLEHPLEEEKEKPVDGICEVEKKVKCGLSADWDPRSFRYLLPTLEEKQAEILKRNELRLQHEQERSQRQLQEENEHQQPEQSSAEEEPLEEKVVPAPLQGEDTTCPHTELLLNEAVGYICADCAIVTTKIEELVPCVVKIVVPAVVFLLESIVITDVLSLFTLFRFNLCALCVQDAKQRHSSGETSDWDTGTRSPDFFQELTEYQKTLEDEEVTLMNSCDLPLRMRNAMHPHQKDGFKFLWRNLARGEGSTRKMREDRNAGCILSHAPGTGKTFLVIGFLQSYINHFPVCRPMIVAPKIMLRQWEKEFQRWKSDISVYILNTARECGKRILQRHEHDGLLNSKNPIAKAHLDSCRLAMLVEWQRSRSVLLVSYNLFTCLTDESRIRLDESRERKDVRSMLLAKPSLLVLDEGHFPRGTATRVRRSLMAVKTNTRILLSGTLFQNNFGELFNTLYLVRPGFVERFFSFVPSSDGDGHSDLKKLLEMEEVTKAAEHRARKFFVEEVGMKIEQGQSSKGHSDQLDFGLARLGSVTTDFVHHHSGEVLSTLPGLRDFAVILKPTERQCHLLESFEKSFGKRAQYLWREIGLSYISIHPGLVGGQSWAEFIKLLDINTAKDSESIGRATATGKKEMVDPKDGVKTKFVFDLLRFCNPEKEKVIVFSQHISPLDLLASMFVSEFKWREDTEYLKLDGKLSLDERQKIIEKFNNPNGEVCVLLASTKACGEGISLVGASRVVFLDVLWNPAVIKQAMSRAFRLGQKKIVYVYRLIASGTIEESKYKKAIRKDWLSRAIFSVSEAQKNEMTDAGAESAAKVQVRGAGESEVTERLMDGRCGGSCVEKPVVGDATSNLSVSEGIQRLRKFEELLAWEVDARTCKDAMLERVLENDRDAERKTFVKVIEHGSDFRESSLPFGPDAREWFLEGFDENDAVDLGDSEPVDLKDANEDEADEEDEEEI